MTGTANFPEYLPLRMTTEEKIYIMKHCPQDVSLSRFIVSCAMIHCTDMDRFERDMDGMAAEKEARE